MLHFKDKGYHIGLLKMKSHILFIRNMSKTWGDGEVKSKELKWIYPANMNQNRADTATLTED